MARVVRKVSGKAVRGQKKGLLYSKKFWISIVAAAVAIVAVVLGLVFGLGGNESSEATHIDQFTKEHTVNVALPDFSKNDKNQIYEMKDAADVKVSFTKASYAEVIMHTNDNNSVFYNDHIFVFAADLSAFNPIEVKEGDKVVVEKNDDHAKIFNALLLLQAEIDNYNAYFNETPKQVQLFIVDTKEADGSENASILTDAKFGGSEGTTALLSLYSNQELIKDFKMIDSNKTKTILTTSATGSAVQDSVNASIIYIRQLFKSAE